MIILFINPIGKHIILESIDTEKRTVIEALTIPKTGNDFEIVPGIFVEFSKKYPPREIWCITGPGTFTLMRIITLILNSIAYHQAISLKSCHYFNLIGTGELTPILEANRHEYLTRDDLENDVIIKKEDIPHGKFTGYIDEDNLPGYTPYEPSLDHIIQVFSLKYAETRLSPLYIKPPHITLGSKKTLVVSSNEVSPSSKS